MDLKFKRLSSVKIQSVNFKIYYIFDKKSLFIANCVFYFVHIRYILLHLIRVIALFSWQRMQAILLKKMLLTNIPKGIE